MAVLSKAFQNVVKGIIIGIPITITFLDCVGYVAKVEGISMQPILNPEGRYAINDYVLLNRWSVHGYKIQRGEVVSLFSPSNPDQKIIKRVIALQGDTVRTLTYKEPYITIPEGHCWVEGDHHAHSMDSNMFGPVALGLITAKASHIVWPPKRWQKLTAELEDDRVPLNLSLSQKYQQEQQRQRQQHQHLMEERTYTITITRESNKESADQRHPPEVCISKNSDRNEEVVEEEEEDRRRHDVDKKK